MENETYGAAIERGRIETISEEGYTVISQDRKGIITPPIPAIGENTYEAGDAVYFFLFRDGTGGIIAPVQEVT